MVELLNAFIRRFVLCSNCKNPETFVEVDKKENVSLQCIACGSTTRLKGTDKLTNFIARNPPPPSKKVKGTAFAPQGNTNTSSSIPGANAGPAGGDEDDDGAVAPPVKSSSGKKHGKKAATDDDDGDWSVDVSEAAVAARYQAEFKGSARAQHFQNVEQPATSTSSTTAEGEGAEEEDSPVDVLKAFLKSTPDASAKQILQKIDSLKSDYDLSERQLVCLAHQAFFDDAISADIIKKRAAILKKYVTNESTEKVLLGYTEIRVTNEQDKDKLLPKVAAILEAFYDHDLLSEEVILSWAKRKKSKYVTDVDVLKQIKTAAKPFIEWLKTADEED